MTTSEPNGSDQHCLREVDSERRNLRVAFTGNIRDRDWRRRRRWCGNCQRSCNGNCQEQQVPKPPFPGISFIPVYLRQTVVLPSTCRLAAQRQRVVPWSIQISGAILAYFGESGNEPAAARRTVLRRPAVARESAASVPLQASTPLPALLISVIISQTKSTQRGA
jgi:hypothetical protein